MSGKDPGAVTTEKQDFSAWKARKERLSFANLGRNARVILSPAPALRPRGVWFLLPGPARLLAESPAAIYA
jgi:hypothetical protein